jgi:hypothetical protein
MVLNLVWYKFNTHAILSVLYPSLSELLSPESDSLINRSALSCSVNGFSSCAVCDCSVVTIAWGSSSLSEESSLELDELPSSDDESDNCSVVVDVGAKLLGADMGAEAGTVAGNEAMTRGDSCGLAFDATAVDTRAGSGEILPLSFGLSLTILFKVVIALFAVGVLTRLSCIVLVTLSRVTSPVSLSMIKIHFLGHGRFGPLYVVEFP